jgi:hypothetical protein
MQNMQLEVKGNELIIRVQLDKDLGPSKTGKTILVATSNGNVPIPGSKVATFIGLNIYRRKV